MKLEWLNGDPYKNKHMATARFFLCKKRSTTVKCPLQIDLLCFWMIPTYEQLLRGLFNGK